MSVEDQERLKKSIETVNQSGAQCDQFLEDMKATQVKLTIDLICARIRLAAKQLFACHYSGAGDHQYDILYKNFIDSIAVLTNAIQNKFKPIKKRKK